MKPKLYHILDIAVEEGIKRGWHRAHKHVENPSEDSIKEAIEDAVMSSIHEYFTFDEGDYYS
jgi:hypothetical protein